MSKRTVIFQAPAALALMAPAALPALKGGRLMIVVPVITAHLNREEEASLASLRRYGGSHERCLLMPEGLQPAFDHSDFTLVHLPKECFANIQSYNALMLSGWFYDLFGDYEYMLVFQLDCLLLGADIGQWLAQDYSYIGAPWFNPKGESRGVGNGGFSLRRIADFQGVFQSAQFSRRGALPQQRQHFRKLKTLKRLHGGVWKAKRSGQPLAKAFISRFTRAEDEFWAYYARFFHPHFKIAPPQVAGLFAIEAQPERVLKMNGGKLPLGCHAWAKYSPTLWRTLSPDLEDYTSSASRNLSP